MRKKYRFHGLKRIKIRQSWNKYNLYNLSRITKLAVESKTFYQQKWAAKSSTRAYHGEQIREKQWERMFRPRLASVVPMKHTYLARYDGSEKAAGRGSGADTERVNKPVPKTPYMSMVYAPMERRLDTAIFRALFASSARQARQFVVHGAVKVNGKKMIYPGYLLNPGDMFQVEPDRVLFATGAPKDKYERHDGRRMRRKAKDPSSTSEDAGKAIPDDIAEVDEDAAIPASDEQSTKPEDKKAAETDPSSEQKKRLSSLLSRARTLLDDSKSGKAALKAKRKQDLRAFQREVRRAMSRARHTTTFDVNNLDAQMSEILSKISLSPGQPSSSAPSQEPSAPVVSPDEKRALEQALKELQENPIDPTKPYATPWRPRDYMSAFAFIPRYLEVNQNICSAVYLRHPVARPGLAEVPSPFPVETHQLAFNWYLRRR